MNYSNSSCRETIYFDSDLYATWKNYSTFNSSADLENYICAFNQYRFYENIIQSISGYASVCCGIIGLVSSVLTLLTLQSTKYFKSTSFIYFRLIAIFEILDMVIIFVAVGFTDLYPAVFFRTYSWFWFVTYIGSGFANFVPGCVDFYTIALSVERVVASLKPSLFESIHKKSFVWKITAATICFNALLFFPICLAQSIAENQNGEYYIVPSAWSQSGIYLVLSYVVDIYILFLASCVILTAILGLVGMLRFLKLR